MKEIKIYLSTCDKTSHILSATIFLYKKLLQELYRDYLALTYDDDFTPDNILRMIEMGDEGIDALIKTYEYFDSVRASA